MSALLSSSVTLRQMLDVRRYDTYDSLVVSPTDAAQRRCKTACGQRRERCGPLRS